MPADNTLLSESSLSLRSRSLLYKRGFDLIVAGSLLVLLVPVFVMIAIWVKCDSQGPVVFRQARVGKNGRLFIIYKFRTMTVQQTATDFGICTDNDPRITRCGQCLRRYHLDEMLQLWNVIKGDMSLVGPRPELAEYIDYYPEPLKSVVLTVSPGITDEASIKFRHEGAILAHMKDPHRYYIDHILPLKAHYQVAYIRRRSLWFDVVILLRTLYSVMVR